MRTARNWGANLDNLFGQREARRRRRKRKTTISMTTRKTTSTTRKTTTSTTRDEEDDLDDDLEEEDDEDEKAENRYDRHPLYQAASALSVYTIRSSTSRPPPRSTRPSCG